jgi:hypothetical protein
LEYLTAGQALSFHAPESLACGTRAALALLREHVDVYTEDRILAPDIAAVTAIIQGEEGIGRVEAQLTHPDNPLRTDWIDGVAVATGGLHAVQGLVGGAHQVFAGRHRIAADGNADAGAYLALQVLMKNGGRMASMIFLPSTSISRVEDSCSNTITNSSPASRATVSVVRTVAVSAARTRSAPGRRRHGPACR